MARATWVTLFGAAVALAALGSCAPDTGVDGASQSLSALERLSGAIFTTLEDGTRVNANLYEAKEDVYLDGGPGPNAPIGAAGLPEGDYYFQVTDPSGKDLLSSDHISCRKVHINEFGVIDLVYGGTNYTWWHGEWWGEPCLHLSGTDVDHDATTVQLYPYDDTKNKGGVYKVWLTPVDRYEGNQGAPDGRHDPVNGEGWEPGNAHGFIPRYSKTDNYKVREERRPTIPPELLVRKFHDRNLDGIQGEGEEEVTGWLIGITDPLDTSNLYYTPVSILATAGLYSVEEDVPACSLETVSALDGATLSQYPSASPTVSVTFEGTSGEVHEVVYGNVGLGDVTACKRYDRNADGVADPDEPPVPGFTMVLSGVAVTGANVGPISQTTDADGCTTFGSLLPGSYTVSEQLPAGDEWVATGPTEYPSTIESSLDGGEICGTSETFTFTNLCVGHADFGTKGYWHNKNGLYEITEGDLDYVNTLSPYATPSSYFDDGDEPFDGLFSDGTLVATALGSSGDEVAPAGSAKAEVSQFLVDPNAGGDPREQLAQQLLAFVFNARHRLDGLGALITMPDGSYVSAGELVALALETWESGTPGEQQWTASLLDWFNNQDALPYVHSTPCTIAP